jgi:hypothetical protein
LSMRQQERSWTNYWVHILRRRHNVSLRYIYIFFYIMGYNPVYAIHETEIKSQKSKYFGFGGQKSKLKSKLAEITSYHMISNSCKIIKTLNRNNFVNIDATDM